MEHDARGTRWDFPPRRRGFFGGLDYETVKLVHGVLRRAQGRDEPRREGLVAACDAVVVEGANRGEAVQCKGADLLPGGSDAAEALPGCDDDDDDDDDDHGGGDHDGGVLTLGGAEEPAPVGKAPPTSTTLRPSAKHAELLQRFAEDSATRRRSAALCHAFGRWSFLTVRMREVRGNINFGFNQRQRVRVLTTQRSVLVALGRHSASNKLARDAANQMLNRARAATAREFLEALASSLQRGRALSLSADALRARVNASADRQALSDAITAWKRELNRSREQTRRAEEMRIDVFTRLSIGAFRAWAQAAGLAGRLRKRLIRADRFLLENVLSAWALFFWHSIAKRARRRERTDLKANRARVRARDAEVLDVAFSDWANATAAAKFRRLRLSARALQGWRAGAKAPAPRGTTSSDFSFKVSMGTTADGVDVGRESLQTQNRRTRSTRTPCCLRLRIARS